MSIEKAFNYILRSSQDRIGKHELHDVLGKNLGEIKHGDGWGCYWVRDGKLEFHKSITPIYEEDLSGWIEKLKGASLLAIHTRLASPGKKVVLESVHPFVMDFRGGKAALVHNGTIEMNFLEFDEEKYIPVTEDSDSERLLYKLLTNLENGDQDAQSMKNTLSTLGTDYSANILFTIPDNFFASTNFGGHRSFTDYLTMQYMVSDKLIIVASEVAYDFEGSWRPLMNKELFHVEIDTFHSEIC